MEEKKSYWDDKPGKLQVTILPQKTTNHPKYRIEGNLFGQVFKLAGWEDEVNERGEVKINFKIDTGPQKQQQTIDMQPQKDDDVPF